MGWFLSAIVLYKVATYRLYYLRMLFTRVSVALAPQIGNIQQRFKSDPQAAKQQLDSLYKSHGANPAHNVLAPVLDWAIFICVIVLLPWHKWLVGDSFLWVGNVTEFSG
ncbi:MAG: YidC/Oxa1 family membrane protein insertase, partial [Planctomycetaceae bacterium]|nr:YidC/Oxa1 family membrane protein insertase [Planctomycetaceae bacterium]